MKKLRRHIILTIFSFLTITFCAQNKLSDEFHLKYKDKNKTIRATKDIRIYSKWVRDSKTMNVHVEPQLDTTFSISQDTLIIRPRSLFYLDYEYDKLYSNEPTHLPLNSTVRMKLPISGIEKITVARDAVQYSTTIIGYLALTSAVLVAPIVSIHKPFNKERYKKVAGYSLITMISALTINLTFGHKKYYLKKHKNKKIWTLN